eukprot:CAMPEP_0169461118 /NCGR_PEP_ID=MMETSP1042-20121227/18857_1 /TAXON_ID=464988 /ORGANISM="Hemiselmis andersenii, Strain CCMP1180" /LENGTH=1020 /DNA_ID=CAMNT_0009573669 /DNA_START=438 /DNA_END=3497 /DNA_ORIENTATION=-
MEKLSMEDWRGLGNGSEDDEWEEDDSRVGKHGTEGKTREQIAKECLEHDQKHRIGVRSPRPLCVVDALNTQGELLRKGDKFESRAAVSIAEAEYQEANLTRSVHVHSSSLRLQTTCRYQGESSCPCKFTATFSSKSHGWTVIELTPHQRCSDVNAQKGNHPAYSRSQLTQLATGAVDAWSQSRSTNLLSNELVWNSINTHVRRRPDDSFLRRLKADALEALEGNPEEEVANLPAIVNCLNECGHKASFKVVDRAVLVDMLVEVAENQHKADQQRKKKDDKEHNMKEFDKESARQSASERVGDTENHILCVHFTPSTTLRMVNGTTQHIVLVTFVDSARMLNGTGGALVSTVAQDAQHSNLAMTYTISTFLPECKQLWEIHQRQVTTVFPSYYRDFIQVNDWNPGLVACNRRMNIAQLSCSHHRGPNFNSNASAADRVVYHKGLKALTKSKLEEVKTQYSVTGLRYANKNITDEEQYMCCVRSPGLFGATTQSAVEGNNSANITVRKASHITCALKKLVEGEGGRYERSREKAQNHPTDRAFPPRIQKSLEEHVLSKAGEYNVNTSQSSGGWKVAEVVSRKDPADRCISRLNTNHSAPGPLTQGSCGRPHLYGHPDKHNAAHAAAIGVRIQDVTDRRLTTAGWKEMYEVGGDFEVPVWSQALDEHPADNSLSLPPKPSRKVGRPDLKRKKSWSEGRRKSKKAKVDKKRDENSEDELDFLLATKEDFPDKRTSCGPKHLTRTASQVVAWPLPQNADAIERQIASRKRECPYIKIHLGKLPHSLVESFTSKPCDDKGFGMTDESLSRLADVQNDVDPMKYWLDDDAINTYAQIERRIYELKSDREKARLPGSVFFNSYTVTKLLISAKAQAYTNTKRWLKKKLLQAIEEPAIKYCFFPVNVNNTHWRLIVLVLDGNEIWDCESLGGGHNPLAAQRVKLVLQQMGREEGIAQLDVDWQIKFVSHPYLMRQTDPTSCGLIVCCLMRCLCSGMEMKDMSVRVAFDQKDMPQIRSKLRTLLSNFVIK